MPSFPFLSLPRELRDRIYIYVLTSPDEPSIASPWNTNPRHELSNNPASGYHGAILHNLPRPRSFTSALLCTSHELHDEVHAAILRFDKSHPEGLSYHLGCMVERDRIWPAWLSLPAPRRYLRHITVDLRHHSEPEYLEFLAQARTLCPTGRLLDSFLGQSLIDASRFLGPDSHTDCAQDVDAGRVRVDTTTVTYTPRPLGCARIRGQQVNDLYVEDEHTWNIKVIIEQMIDAGSLRGYVRLLRFHIPGGRAVFESTSDDQGLAAEWKAMGQEWDIQTRGERKGYYLNGLAVEPEEFCNVWNARFG